MIGNTARIIDQARVTRKEIGIRIALRGSVALTESAKKKDRRWSGLRENKLVVAADRWSVKQKKKS